MNKKNSLTCWIITEGMAGTENQCIGVAESLGVTPIIKHVDLRFPWKQLTPYFRILNAHAFSKKSDPFDAPFPDLIIASGRKSIPASLHIKKASKGKSFIVQIQDPRCNPDLFDMVILPSHDPTRGENVITTIGSLNRITPDKLNAEEKNFFPFFKENLDKPNLAVMIGGNSKVHTLTRQATIDLCEQLNNLSKDYNIMVTASRRTGEENHSLLKHHLNDNEAIYFWQGDGDNPYFSYLARADKIAVTADSASMISESITSGKPTYVIPMEGGGTRIDLFHKEIIENGYAKPFNEGKLMPFTPPPLNETNRIAKMIAQALKKR